MEFVKDVKAVENGFRMYDMYSGQPNNEFNSFLKRSYLDPYRDIYFNQTTTASCPNPGEAFNFQQQQLFIKRYINKETPYRGLLVWHGLGSGKTCASIAIADTFTNKDKVIIMPRSLVDNFKGDYSLCGSIKPKPIYTKTVKPRTKKIERAEADVPMPPPKSISRKKQAQDPALNIGKVFREFTSNGNINSYGHSDRYILENKVLIIDESQLLIEHITNALLYVNSINKQITTNLGQPNDKSINTIAIAKNKLIKTTNNSYLAFYEDLRSLETSRIICLSGTPIIKNSLELAVLFNIIHGDIVSWDIRILEQFGNLDSLGPLLEQIHPRIKNHIDLKNSGRLSNNVFVFYKNPYGFINSPSDVGSIIYNEDDVLTYAEFGIMLKHIFGEENVIEKRRPLFDTTNNNVIKEMDVRQFKHNINGLASYFGNIQKILPRVSIAWANDANRIDQEQESVNQFLLDNNLYKYGIGDDNNSNKLYEIRYVNKSELMRTVISLCDTLPKNGALNASLVDTKLNSTNMNQFVYPALHEYIVANLEEPISITNVSRGRVSQSTKVEEINQMERIKNAIPLNPNMFKVTLKRTDVHARPPPTYEETEPEKKRPMFIREPRDPQSMADEPPLPRTVNKRGMYKLPVYQNIGNIIKNIWDKNDFDKTVSPGFIITEDPNNLLKQCSPKIFEIVKSVINNQKKIHIIYSEYHQVNIPLVRALQANGFSEYKNEHQVLDNRPRYMFYTGAFNKKNTPDREDIQFTQYLQDITEGKAMTPEVRSKLLKNFNDRQNNKGEQVQVIIINSAAAEGITIKNARFVHLLHLPPNISKLFQIIGRAIRNCTHQTLEESQRTVTPILYLSEDNEEKYDESILINRANVPFLDILKESTIDCLLNKQLSSDTKCFIDNETNLPKSMWYGYDILGPIQSRIRHITYMSNLATNAQLLINLTNKAIENAPKTIDDGDDEDEGEELLTTNVVAGKNKKSTRTKLIKHRKKSQKRPKK